MATIKELKKKVGSLKNTRKITNAMKMIAATKLRKAQNAVEESRPYANELEKLLQDTMASSTVQVPLTKEKSEIKLIRLIIFTSDRGLCGPFNSNIIKAANKFIRQKRSEGIEISLSIAGKKAYDFFKNKLESLKHYPEVIKTGDYKNSTKICNQAIEDFLNNNVDAVYVIYNHFKSAINQITELQQLLPIKLKTEEINNKKIVAEVKNIYEPSSDLLLPALVDKAVKFDLYKCLLNSLASEHASRMNAMDNATNNAGDLIDKYTLSMNRARQAAITTELVEIISGAESLKG